MKTVVQDLKDLFSIKVEGKRDDVQCIQFLVPLCHLPLDRNVFGLRRCLRVGYSDGDLPLEETIFLDIWDINSRKY